MYEQQIRKGIQKLLDYKYKLSGLDPKEISTTTVPELVRAIAAITEEEIVVQLAMKHMGKSIIYKHESETAPSGFSFLAFGHK